MASREAKDRKQRAFIRGVSGGATPRERYVGGRSVKDIADSRGKRSYKRTQASFERMGASKRQAKNVAKEVAGAGRRYTRKRASAQSVRGDRP
jgi:hypothetical protein